MFFLNACSRSVDHDSIWREKIVFEDGSHVMLYHSHTCTKHKPFLATTEKMVDFIQYKYTLFDFCLNEEEINALYAINKMNIKYKEQFFYIFAEDSYDYDYHRWWVEVVDTTYRPHKCYYSLAHSELIKLNPFYAP